METATCFTCFVVVVEMSFKCKVVSFNLGHCCKYYRSPKTWDSAPGDLICQAAVAEAGRDDDDV